MGTPFSRIPRPLVRYPNGGCRLRHVLSGCWSRRIDEEHRLVYLVDGGDIVVLQARFHYGK
ncbi:MAG: Txe/YoeB family addiction module toxin [Acidimicrobiales bacterium]